MSATAAPSESVVTTRQRIDSIDILRGLVMVIMALDHVRDFFHAGAQSYSPENLAHTTAFLFFTRWITHYCAPVFMFLSGVGIHFMTSRRGSLATASRFLITRGLWLIFLELTVLNIGFSFNLSYRIVLLQVIWVFGWSMIVMAGLIHLPRRAVLILAVGTIALHNSLDGIKPAQFGAVSWVWNVLHVQAFLRWGNMQVLVLYPLIPWIAVMAAGYCLGPVYQWPPERRRKFLLRLGAVSTAAFFVLRYVNVYADPQKWSIQSTFSLTVISFFRVLKYPPSLDYLLMTLGPALIFLAAMDRVRVSEANPFRVFGRVPMFYYILHFYSIHALSVVLAGLRYGRWDILWQLPPSAQGAFPPGFPLDYGYSLPVTYLIWFCLVAALYLPCLWYMRVKQRSRSPWLSYL